MTLGATGSEATTTLRGLARFMVGVDSNQWSGADVAGLINQYLHTFQVWISEAYEPFKFSGASADTNLVAGTNNYAFPTDFYEVNRIEINYSGNENDFALARVEDLRHIDDDALANLEATEDRTSSTGKPIVYILNNRLYFLRTPGTNVTNGLRVYYSSIQTELSADGDEPVFNENFHRGLAIAAARDYAVAKGLPNANQLNSLLLSIKDDMQKSYVDRINVRQQAFNPRLEDYR